MRKIILVTLAAMIVSMCTGCSQQNSFLKRLEHPVLPSPEYSYSPAEG
jgi:hypothetical protein